MSFSWQTLRLFAVFGVALSCLVASRVGAAEDPLRWKFEVGEKLDYSMVQEMSMSAAAGPAGQMNTTMRQDMDMTWDVQGVDKNTGEAVIKQKFERVKMKMTSPVFNIDYDSKSDAAPVGLAAQIAPMYKAMTNAEFEITMTARGEVKDVKIPEEVMTALKNSPGASQMGDIATPEGFKKMISQGALVLPEKSPMKGEKWSTKVEMNNPQAGKQTVETTYTYDGTKDADGVTYAVIKPELKMTFGERPEGAKPQLSMKIVDQSSDGEILFNVSKGRLSSTTLKQNVTIEAKVASQTIQQKIDQKIEVKVTPAGEKKAEEAKEDEAAQKGEDAAKKESK